MNSWYWISVRLPNLQLREEQTSNWENSSFWPTGCRRRWPHSSRSRIRLNRAQGRRRLFTEARQDLSRRLELIIHQKAENRINKSHKSHMNYKSICLMVYMAKLQYTTKSLSDPSRGNINFLNTHLRSWNIVFLEYFLYFSVISNHNFLTIY